MKLKRLLSVLLALTMCVSVMITSAGAALVVTGDETMETCFPDENFRTAVISAFNEADEADFTTGIKPDLDDSSLKGQVLVDALASFTGIVSARSKGITQANGIEYLVNAEKVDLFKNKITNFDFLWQITNADISYFGTRGAGSDDGRNVEWNVGGNPFEILPYSFGGCLVIDQPATTASVYDESGFRPRVYLRGAEPESQVFNITRCKVYNKTNDGKWHWAMPINDVPNLVGPTILTPHKKNDDTLSYGAVGARLYFSDVIKSGIQVIGIGIGQEVRYVTTDEFGTETPGSQSFKYYIHPQFFVYDKVNLKSESSVTLKKVDADTNVPLDGAVYTLYTVADDGTKNMYLENQTTANGGTLTFADLPMGKYELVETTAPTGYQINTVDKLTFSIGAKLGGGVTSVVTTKDIDSNPASDTVLPSIGTDTTYSVAPKDIGKQIYIAGPDIPMGEPINKTTNQPNDFYQPSSGTAVTLKALSPEQKMAVTVEYTALQTMKKDSNTNKYDGTFDNAQPVIRTFPTAELAASDINKEQNCDCENKVLDGAFKATAIAGTVNITIDQTDKTATGGADNSIVLTHKNTKTPAPPSDPGPSTPTVTVKGEKVWVDDNNSGKTRPASIKVELYRDGGDSPYRTATVSASNNWKYSFTGLAKYRTGNTPYTYTVKEADVPEEYTSAVDSAAGSTGNTVTTTITNTLIPPEKPPVTPEEPKEPSDPTDPQNPNEPPATPPTDPSEPPTTPPDAPNEPGTPPETPPTDPPITPPNGVLPQTGTAAASSAVALCLLALAALCAVCAVFFLRKGKKAE